MITNKEDILRSVDELVLLGRALQRAETNAENCGHNQDHIRVQNCLAAYLAARIKLADDLCKVRIDADE